MVKNISSPDVWHVVPQYMGPELTLLTSHGEFNLCSPIPTCWWSHFLHFIDRPAPCHRCNWAKNGGNPSIPFSFFSRANRDDIHVYYLNLCINKNS